MSNGATQRSATVSSPATINLAELDAALVDAPNWVLLESTLYDLCSRHRGHASRAASNAKLWLIGRGFASGIERLIKSKGGQGYAMTALCNFVHEKHVSIDKIIGLLAGVAEPLDTEKLERIAVAHGRLCRLLRPVLRKLVVPRSFAAKYLHFHCPAVPIYDKYAVRKATRLVRWHDGLKVFEKPQEADDEYYWFLLRFWQLYQAARQVRPEITVRLLDLYLLW